MGGGDYRELQVPDELAQRVLDLQRQLDEAPSDLEKGLNNIRALLPK
ncbi:MAG: hypothetical protein WC595_01365 [Candidatus Nanoarchaeia archaeon]